MNRNNTLAIILPRIENEVNIKVNFIRVRFCLKYVMNPANEDNNMINVEVSIAILIGIKSRSVKVETKKTPPPTPAITAIVPDKKPNRINKSITKKENSILRKRSYIS